MQGLKYQINVYCKETVLQNIRSVLKAKSRTGYKEFQNSCFGVFSKLPKVVGKCNSAVYYVLTHEIVFSNGGDDTEMCFLINDKIVRFRRFEYALITGLKFGKSSFDPNGNHNIPEGSLHTRMFRNAKVKVEDLFNEFEGKRLGDIAEDYLKAAKILFVYYVLLGMDPKKTNVAHWMWVLVEDNDRWEKFPWGSYSYQHLIRYLKKIRKKPSKTAKKHAIHMYGFTTAFMVRLHQNFMLMFMFLHVY